MSVTLTGTGGLFKRLGKIFGACANVISLGGGTATSDVASGASMATHGSDLEQYAAESPAVSDQIDGHWTAISGWRAAQSVLFSSFATIARNIIIRQVDLDASLPSKDITTAMKELRRQMRANGTSIQQSTVSAGSQTSVGSPNGTCKSVYVLKDNEGYTTQTPRAEVIRMVTTSDSQTGGATARREQVTFTGQPAVTDASSYLWPGGSGASKTLTLIDAQAYSSSGNLMTGGAFETFTTAGYPDNFVIRIGTQNVDFQAAGSGYTLNNALRIIGDGSTLPCIYQPFNTTATTSAGAGGTPARLKPATTYAVGLWMKKSASLIAGVLRIALVDGSNTVTNDVSGTANSTTVTLSGLTTSYAFQSVTFRTPTTLPTSGLRLELKCTTALTSGESAYIDDLAMCEMTQLYAGGPYVAVFTGDTNTTLNDTWTVTISSSMGVMASWLERLIGLNAMGVQLGYSGSPTVADSLVS